MALHNISLGTVKKRKFTMYFQRATLPGKSKRFRRRSALGIFSVV